ncbi:MAG: radical SAM protein [Clostridiales bacterium]|nr:radical SAM protein [Clostridiales bacterium]
MRYKGKVYRPPSEAYSLIVQVTYGCSHNRCAFCGMYDDKHFSMRPMQEIREDFELARRVYKRVERVFLADGDALMRKTADLVEILGLIYGLFPECERVSCYASPASLQVKSEDELRLLRARGLQMVYMGLESGCDAVLTRMQKGHDAAAIVAAGQKARRCGFALSVTAISGLGSVALWRQHAADTAKAVSAIKPEYLGLLTLMVEHGTPLESWVKNGEFTLLSPLEVLKETELFLQQVDSEGTVFRANHASNYLTLKGTLNGDREALLGQIGAALAGRRDLKPEFLRAL